MRVNKTPPGPHETRDILILQILGVLPIGPAFRHASPPPENPYDVDSVEEIGLIGIYRINRHSLRSPR